MKLEILKKVIPYLFVGVTLFTNCKIYKNSRNTKHQNEDLVGNWLGAFKTDSSEIHWLNQRNSNGHYIKFYVESTTKQNKGRVDIGKWWTENDTLNEYCPNNIDTPITYIYKLVDSRMLILKNGNLNSAIIENKIDDTRFESFELK